jgi:adenylate cyclase, class 2
MSGAVETEVKIRVPDLAAVEDRLKAAGFLLHVPRAFEANTLYDTPGQSLRMAGCILRLREVAGRHLLTFKGQEKNGPYKSREEVETTLGSFEAMHTVLAHLGYHPVFRYEKYRAEFKVSADAPGVVTLDHTPIGVDRRDRPTAGILPVRLSSGQLWQTLHNGLRAAARGTNPYGFLVLA